MLAKKWVEENKINKKLDKSHKTADDYNAMYTTRKDQRPVVLQWHLVAVEVVIAVAVDQLQLARVNIAFIDNVTTPDTLCIMVMCDTVD